MTDLLFARLQMAMSLAFHIIFAAMGIGIGNVGVPRLAFAHFFGAAMMKPDIAGQIHDLFAGELCHDAEQAVRARVLRTDIQEHAISAATIRAYSINGQTVSA